MLKDTLLIEIGTEELPPKLINKIASTLGFEVEKQFLEQHIQHGKISVFGAPRRIAFIIEDTANIQDPIIIQKRGPSIEAAYMHGAPTQAAHGFASSCGVTLSRLDRLKTKDGEWLLFVSKEEGKPLAELLSAILTKAINELPIPKPMRWSEHTHKFIRPVHWFIAMLGDKILPINLFGLNANHYTVGHRFLSNHQLELKHANDYVKTLQDNFVIADFITRKNLIKQKLEEYAKSIHAVITIDENLLEEVTGIIDYPTVLSAKFNADFLQVPSVALICAIQNHQKCFPLFNDKEELINQVLLVTNTKTNNYQNIIQGNERVMAARLSDARFFFTQDKEHNLEFYLDHLKQVIFEKQLGSMYEKSLRCANAAKLLATQLFPDLKDAAFTAAKLAKADLTTNMVKEFPELQGIMGYHYLLHENRDLGLALAIKESYYPRFANDILPASNLGSIVAIIDKLDTLVGIFGIGKKPTGEKDPFALRRAALGILRILIEKQIDIDLSQLIALMRSEYKIKLIDGLEKQLLNFFIERMRIILQETYSPQIAEAVLKNNLYHPSNLMLRAQALFKFASTKEAVALAATNKRIKNILVKNNIDTLALQPVNKALLTESDEINLYTKLQDITASVTEHTVKHQYFEALNNLSRLQPEVDAFFTSIMVMCEDTKIRENRLNLLTSLYQTCTKVADISCL